MKCCDPHTRLDAMRKADIEMMALCGMAAVVTDASPLPAISAQSVIENYDKVIVWDLPRAKDHLIEPYMTIGMNMLWIPPDWPKVVEALPKYLKKDRIVGIGEIGIDPRSFSTPDLSKQEEVLRAQLDVVAKTKTTVILHIPPMDKMMYLEKHFKRIEEFKIDKNKVIITHCDAELAKAVIKFGCFAEITMQPWRKLGPEEAAKMLKVGDIDLNRVMVDSDTAVRVASDLLAVPRCAFEMRKLGMKDADISKVVYENALRAFNIKQS